MDQNSQPKQPNSSYVDDYAPPTQNGNAQASVTPDPQPMMAAPQPTYQPPVQAAAKAPTAQAAVSSESELLEDQNIFIMLGINQIPEKEKDSFLDELQQVIWEDFVENDSKLLLTQEEYGQFSALAGKTYANEDEKQGTLIEFVEKLVPDLEKIMLEKALELKEEMFRERIKEMKKSKPAMAETLKQAEAAMADGKWLTATNLINQR